MTFFTASPEAVADHKELVALNFAQWQKGERPLGMACVIAEDGVYSVLLGLPGLARRCFEAALPYLLRDVGPGGAPESPTRFVPASSEALHELSEELGGNVPVVGGGMIIGWDALAKSDTWLYVALCRWFLEQKHDGESLKRASDELHRAFWQDHPEAQDLLTMDRIGALFHAAGEDQRLLECLAQCRRFKPPDKAASVRARRAMAYVLARHRLEHFWSDDQVAHAWQVFLTMNVPWLLDNGPIQELALWMKLAFWDQAKPRPTPNEALLRVYDFLPGVPRPRIEQDS